MPDSGIKLNHTDRSRNLKGDVPKMILNIVKLDRMEWKNEWESKELLSETLKSIVGKGGLG